MKLEKLWILLLFVFMSACGGGSSSNDEGLNADNNSSSGSGTICVWNFIAAGSGFGGHVCTTSKTECEDDARKFADDLGVVINGKIETGFFEDETCA